MGADPDVAFPVDGEMQADTALVGIREVTVHEPDRQANEVATAPEDSVETGDTVGASMPMVTAGVARTT